MPRKNVAGFPGRAERERLMKELQTANDPQLRNFANAVKTLDDAMTPYERPKGKYNLAPALKAEDRTRLMEAILAAARVSESYLAACEKAKKDMTRGTPALAEEL